MVSKAIARFIRISPRKTRLVADAIKGKNIGEALAILTSLNRRPCVYIEELLRSAIANAKKNPDVEENSLYISKLSVDKGPMLKRFRAASMGRAMMVRHRTSHIRIELDLLAKAKVQHPQKKGLRAQAPEKRFKLNRFRRTARAR